MFVIVFFDANAIGYLTKHVGDSVIYEPIINSRGNIVMDNHDFVFTITIDGEPRNGEVIKVVGTDTMACPIKNICRGTSFVKDSVVQSITGDLFYRTGYIFCISKKNNFQVKKEYDVEIILKLPDTKEWGTFKGYAGIIDFQQVSSRIRRRAIKRYNALPYYYYAIGPWFQRVKTIEYARIKMIWKKRELK